MASQENADEEAKLARHNAGLESGDRRLMVKVVKHFATAAYIRSIKYNIPFVFETTRAPNRT
jgi:hypothetical protein